MSKVKIRPQLLEDIYTTMSDPSQINLLDEINRGYPKFPDPSHIDSLTPEGLVMIKNTKLTNKQGKARVDRK